MAFFFTRPTRLNLSQECQKIAKSMRRQPLHKNGKINFRERIKTEEENGVGVKEEPKALNESSSDEKGSSNDSKESIDTLDGKGESGKLSKIVKKLSEQMASRLALNGNASNGHHHHASTAIIPTSYSLASHIANNINSQSPHQHVSPRKRILRELEKVTLEDTKRSRVPKSITTNGTSNITHLATGVASNGSLTKNNEKPPASSSRPISSYSITSLLAHNNTSSSSQNDSSTSQHHNRLHSPEQKQKSPHMQSPIQSPSPEHQHAFHKYRPMTTTPTSQSMPPASSSSPYNSSYHSPSYMRGSPSPSDALNSRLRTTGNFQQSPSHHYAGTSSSPSNYLPTQRDSSLSPNVEKTSSRSTPTTPAGIRTVPKKTAALRQQFSSPTMNESTSKQQKASPNLKNDVKPMDVDALLRPSPLIPPPIPQAALNHPAAAALSHYPYMYSPLSYLPPPTVPPYYHPFYNPAVMAAAAAAYRFPMPGYPGTVQIAPQQQPQHTSYAPAAESKTTTNGQQSNSSSPHSIHHHPAYSSPWNPIPITNHSINDGNLIPKVKDEPPSSGEFF